MMIALGRFLELSVPAADVLESLGFYRSLGFTEWTTGDIRRWHYAVVTDGAITIGLHQEGFDEPALSFVYPGLARQVRVLEARGQAFDWRQLGDDDFHEAGFSTADGHCIRMMEARTFSPGEKPGPTLLASPCAEVSLHCADPAATQSWLEARGFLPAAAPLPDGTPLLNAPGLALGLRGGRPAGATLRFRPADPQAVAGMLAARGVGHRRVAGGIELRAPEGTRLLVET